MKFHKSSLKLASLYLGIMMVISLSFSVNLYQLTENEFDRGFRGPGAGFGQLVTSGAVSGGTLAISDEPLRTQIIAGLDQRYQEAKARMFNRLLIVNLIILVGGGVLSYYLALRTLKPIEEAREAQSRFTADASHELRTPITAMRTENEVTLMDPKLSLAAAKKQIVSNIEELDKLNHLSEGLLRLASLENNHLLTTDVRLGTVVDAATTKVQPLAQRKAIKLSTKISRDLTVLADGDSLTEALSILLDNAIKYSPNSADVTVHVKPSHKQVAIEVQDQGPGISDTDLPHLFERFYRADTARSKKQADGYGLGLAIAKNIVDLHKGSLSVRSTVGKGSTFTITLPSKT